LVVAEQDAFFAEFLSEDPVFSQQVIDSFLLSTIDPTSKDQEQELPGLQHKLHMTPDGCVIMKNNSIRNQQRVVNRSRQWDSAVISKLNCLTDL
jgi:hypothetical protein